MTAATLRSTLEARYDPQYLDLERLQANLVETDEAKAKDEEALPALAVSEPTLAIQARSNIAMYERQIEELRTLIAIKREWDDAN